MFKTVILGCENSHANSFLKYIKEDSEFSDIEVIGIYSNEEDKAQKLSEEFGVPVMNSYDEAVGKVDGVIITARHGDNHLKYAEKYIKNGVSFFIDKPFTCSVKEGEKLCKMLTENGCRFVGGSSLMHTEMIQKLKAERINGENGKTIGGFLRHPVDLSSPYGGIYFYAHHLITSVIEAFGDDIKSVSAVKNATGLNVVFRYSDYDVTGMFAELNYVYYAVRHSEKGVSGGEFTVGVSASRKEMEEFHDILTGKSSGMTAESILKPVYVMDAIVQSLDSGKEEQVK